MADGPTMSRGQAVRYRLAARRAVMAKLEPIVSWDRCVQHAGTLIVYGWIPRSDGQRDYAELAFLWADQPDAYYFTTSSAKHSKHLWELLAGPGATHVDCERVADVFGA